MERIMDPRNRPRQTALQYFQNLEFPDPTVLDEIRQYEKNFPLGGIYAPEFLGLPDEPRERDEELAALSARVRVQLIRKFLATISYNPDRFGRFQVPEQADHDDDNEVIENAHVLDDGTVANPVVIDDDGDLSENGYAPGDGAVSNPDVADGSETDEEEDASDDGAISDSNYLDDTGLYEDSDDVTSSDSDSRDNSQALELAEVSYNTAFTEYDDDGGSGLKSTEPKNTDGIENVSLVREAGSKGTQALAEIDGNESDDDGSDYFANARRTVQRPSKPANAPPKTIKKWSKTGSARPNPRKPSNESSPCPFTRFRKEDFHRGSTRLLAKALDDELLPKSINNEPLDRARNDELRDWAINDELEAEYGHRSSLGKRSRKHTQIGGSNRSSYINDDEDEDDVDFVPIAKKAKVRSGPQGTLPRPSRMNFDMHMSAPQEEFASSATQYFSATDPPQPRQLSGSTASRGATELAGSNIFHGIQGLVSDGPLPGMQQSTAATLPDMAGLPGANTSLQTQPSMNAHDSLAIANPQAIPNPPVTNNSTTAGGGSATNNNNSRGRRSWSDAEHDAIHRELRALRAHEAVNNRAGPLGLRDEKLWGHISRVLRERHQIHRSLAGCKYYWGRFGRAKSGFDERAFQDSDKLSTSVQRKKK